MPAQPTHDSEHKGQYSQRDGKADNLIRPRIIQKTISADDEETRRSERGDDPRNRKQFTSEKIPFLAALDAHLAVFETLESHL